MLQHQHDAAWCRLLQLLSSIVIPTTCLLFTLSWNTVLASFVAHVHSFTSFTCTHYMHSYVHTYVPRLYKSWLWYMTCLPSILRATDQPSGKMLAQLLTYHHMHDLSTRAQLESTSTRTTRIPGPPSS